MNDRIASQVSAFLDGELPETECELLLRRLAAEPEAGRAARRYLLMGQAMRGELVGDQPQAMARRIAEVVAQEPAAAAAEATRSQRPAWLRPLAGTGVAAAVAVAAVMVLQGGAPSEPVEADSARVEAYTVTPLSAGERGASIDAEFAPATTPPVRLTNYLMSHGEFAGSLGRKSIQSGIVGTSAAQVMSGVAEAPEVTDRSAGDKQEGGADEPADAQAQ